MTSLVLNYPRQDHSTVVTVDVENQEASIESTKFKSYSWKVWKPRDQTAFFKVSSSKNKVAEELEGHWSSLQKAIDAVVDYIDKAVETQAAKNERLDNLRKERNAAKRNSEGS